MNLRWPILCHGKDMNVIHGIQISYKNFGFESENVPGLQEDRPIIL